MNNNTDRMSIIIGQWNVLELLFPLLFIVLHINTFKGKIVMLLIANKLLQSNIECNINKIEKRDHRLSN